MERRDLIVRVGCILDPQSRNVYISLIEPSHICILLEVPVRACKKSLLPVKVQYSRYMHI
jgi:hypothetical protein